MIEDPARVWLGNAKRRNLRRLQRLWLHGVAAVRGTDEPPSRPIFVVGCPRSGTSLLFTLLRRHDDVRSLPGEGHVLWSTYQHPRLKGWSSDRLTAEDIRPREPRYLYTGVRRIAGAHRFLDKTPKNVLRMPYLAKLFPDARFVLLKRDGRATVSSLIEGWRVRQSPSYRLPERLQLSDYQGRMWSYILPPGWRDWTHTSIAEVAAFQYVSSYEIALDDTNALKPDAVVELAFEDLVRNPVDEVARLLDRLELGPSSRVTEMAQDLGAYPVMANSPPRPDKWRDRSNDIERVLPQIAPTMARLGYDV